MWEIVFWQLIKIVPGWIRLGQIPNLGKQKDPFLHNQHIDQSGRLIYEPAGCWSTVQRAAGAACFRCALVVFQTDLPVSVTPLWYSCHPQLLQSNVSIARNKRGRNPGCDENIWKVGKTRWKANARVSTSGRTEAAVEEEEERAMAAGKQYLHMVKGSREKNAVFFLFFICIVKKKSLHFQILWRYDISPLAFRRV